MKNNYSKRNPSKSYLNNIDYYKIMHETGYKKIDGTKREPENAYDGKSTIPFAKIIKKIILKNKCNSLLDYGCGKAKYYFEKFDFEGENFPNLKDYWGGINIDLYDPCYKKFNNLTKEKVDISICVDVLEHIPLEDIDWVLSEFISLTNKFVFINVACSPAVALLPNGKNAHINLQQPQWWKNKLNEFAKEFENLKIICTCSYILQSNGETKWAFVEIRDNISKYLVM
jgi:hypothetical protein